MKEKHHLHKVYLRNTKAIARNNAFNNMSINFVRCKMLESEKKAVESYDDRNNYKKF